MIGLQPSYVQLHSCRIIPMSNLVEMLEIVFPDQENEEWHKDSADVFFESAV